MQLLILIAVTIFIIIKKKDCSTFFFIYLYHQAQHENHCYNSNNVCMVLNKKLMAHYRWTLLLPFGSHCINSSIKYCTTEETIHSSWMPQSRVGFLSEVVVKQIAQAQRRFATLAWEFCGIWALPGHVDKRTALIRVLPIGVVIPYS